MASQTAGSTTTAFTSDALGRVVTRTNTANSATHDASGNLLGVDAAGAYLGIVGSHPVRAEMWSLSDLRTMSLLMAVRRWRLSTHQGEPVA